MSNDSFQEFHGQYEWLFDEGRLLGGKPIPGVGWVFLLENTGAGPQVPPVGARGQGRQAEPHRLDRGRRHGVDRSQPSRPRRDRHEGGRRATSRQAGEELAAPKAPKAPVNGDAEDQANRRAKKPAEAINHALPFIEFVGAHPVGSVIEATVDQFSSHGAYVATNGIRCYVPLRLMGDPAPRSAKEVLTIGETRSFVVHSIDAPHRGIDLGARRRCGARTCCPHTRHRDRDAG